MNSKSIYDELKSGRSAEELRKIFEKEIDAAQTKIKSEEDTSLTKARINLVHAIVTYLQALDIINESFSEEKIKDICDLLQEEEADLKDALKQLKMFAKIINFDALDKLFEEDIKCSCDCKTKPSTKFKSTSDIDTILDAFKEMYKD